MNRRPTRRIAAAVVAVVATGAALVAAAMAMSSQPSATAPATSGAMHTMHATAYAAGNYEQAAKADNAAYEHMFMTGDLVAGAIAKQKKLE